jgi:hypothetical protein
MYWIVAALAFVISTSALAVTQTKTPLDLSMRQAIYFTGSKTEKIDLSKDKYVGSGKVLSLTQNVATKCEPDGGCFFNFGVVVWRTLNGKETTDGELSTYGYFSLPDFSGTGNTLIFHDGEGIVQFIEPVKLKLGDNKVTFTLDPYKKTPEANEANNAVTVTVRVLRMISSTKPTTTK